MKKTSLVIMAAIVICIFGAVTGLSVSTALTKPQYTNVTITAVSFAGIVN